LRNLRSLSMPGNRIPDWFSPELIFSKRKNREIKGVLIGLVVSVDHQIADDKRDQLPLIRGIRANILKLNSLVFSTMLELKGIPMTPEDHIYMFRYHEYRPLVSQLKDGYKINVTQDDPPYIEGIKVEKCGIYLIFDGEDDYGGDEESLEESQLSISEKLAKFFSSIEDDDDHISGSGDEVKSQVQEIERQEGREKGVLLGGIRQLVGECLGFFFEK
jgi:hypothetical protein